MKKLNCFGWGGWKCSVTYYSDCDKCPFFKTREQKQLEEEKCFERLRKLSQYQQDYISQQYYNYTYPWRGDKRWQN